MWLTGFDVKCLATMHLDKPMPGHTLMQAIARVNRVGGGKKHGLVIDYNGMLKSLRKSLATFAQGDRGGTGKGEGEEDTVRDDSAGVAIPRYDLLKIDIARRRAAFDKTPHKSVVMLNLQEKLEQRLAVFGLLQKESLTQGDREKIKAVAKDILQTLSVGLLGRLSACL